MLCRLPLTAWVTCCVVFANGWASAQETSAASADTKPAAEPPQTVSPQTVPPQPVPPQSAAPVQPAEEISPTTSAAEREIPLGEDDALRLADVIASLYRSYPEVERARHELALSQGLVTEAYGAYDTKLDGYTLNQPLGNFRNYRHGIGVARQTWWNGYLAAGYRLGRGVFPPWYLERETEKGGEFKLAYAAPLLQGRAIDPNRVAVFQANLQVQAVTPTIQLTVLDYSLEAVTTYWQWVSSGLVVIAQQDLVDLAQQRQRQLEETYQAGRAALIDVILSRQQVAERSAKLISAQQKYFANGQKLSLFLRDEAGNPLVPSAEWLPSRFPLLVPQPSRDFSADLQAALSRRPEPVLLQIDLQQMRWDQRLAGNQLLPQVDFVSEGAQDFGGAASSSNNKGEFELTVGLEGQVPLQRRKARGKLQSTSAKLNQTDQKLRLTIDKIGAELRIANNALVNAAAIVDQNLAAFRTAVDALQRFRFAFEQGRIDLVYLNLFETKVTETEIYLIEAQSDWFIALAQMQRALGLDPLEQAIQIDSLPASDMPGPGNMPTAAELQDSALQQDFNMRNGLNGANPSALNQPRTLGGAAGANAIAPSGGGAAGANAAGVDTLGGGISPADTGQPGLNSLPNNGLNPSGGAETGSLPPNRVDVLGGDVPSELGIGINPGTGVESGTGIDPGLGPDPNIGVGEGGAATDTTLPRPGP